MNTMLVNSKLSQYWKSSIIQRIPKKNFSVDDLSTLRDISLQPTCYKVFSNALCKRILPFITNEIAFWQRAYMNHRNRKELIFALKTSIVDIKHMCNSIYIAFIDFADAFGSVKLDYVFETLDHFNIPRIYSCLLENLYRYSSFRVIFNHQLTKDL